MSQSTPHQTAQGGGSWPRSARPCSPSTSTPRSSTSRCRRSRASSRRGTRQLQWVVDGYNLAFAGAGAGRGQPVRPVRPAAGPDHRPGRLRRGQRRRARWSRRPEALVAARFVMGAFAALIFPTTLSIISNTFRERRERAAALGIWGAVVGLGVAAGPVTGGVLLEHFYWGSVFWALVPLALVTAVAAYVLVPESRDPSVPRARPARPRPVGGDAGHAHLHDHRGAGARLVVGGDARRVRGRGRAAGRLRASASGVRRTRCSTSRCSATAGSAPPAEPSRSRSSRCSASSSWSRSTSSSSAGTARSSTGARILPVALSHRGRLRGRRCAGARGSAPRSW